LKFVSDLLSSRSIRRVRVGVAMSNSYQLQNGTPQVRKSVVMVNDIDEARNGIRLSLYADDSDTWKPSPNLAAPSSTI